MVSWIVHSLVWANLCLGQMCVLYSIPKSHQKTSSTCWSVDLTQTQVTYIHGGVQKHKSITLLCDPHTSLFSKEWKNKLTELHNSSWEKSHWFWWLRLDLMGKRDIACAALRGWIFFAKKRIRKLKIWTYVWHLPFFSWNRGPVITNVPNYQNTRGEVSVNTRYFIEHLIFPWKSIKHFLYK